jgi:diaminopimelate decarboxylase
VNDTTFQYKNTNGSSELFCEDTPLSEIATRYGTPLYVYSKAQVVNNFSSFYELIKKSGDQNWVSFAVKANSNQEILKLLASCQAGASVVSGGELLAALKAGFDPNKISFDGPGKTDDEITLAIEKNIFAIDIESMQELNVVNDIAGSLGKKANICIRVNPHVDAKTHPYISTGLSHNKFGISFEDAVLAYRIAKDLPHIEIVGLHSHIGSQITELSPFVEAAQSIVEFIAMLRNREGIELKHINIGGGQPVLYHHVVSHDFLPKDDANTSISSFEEYASAILPILSTTGCTINIEPGRAIIANGSVLLTKVLYKKSNGDKNFIIVDAAMSDLIRPSLYQAYHQIVPLFISTKEHFIVDIVGPICETGDFFAKDRTVNVADRNALLAIMCTGAYGYTLASNYNLRPRAAEILVDGDSSSVIRSRERVEDIIG